MQGPRRLKILGIGFDPVTLAEAASRIEAMVGGRRREGPGIVVTANPEIVQAARRDPELRSILHQADLVLPDGVGVVWAGRILGLRFPERVTGADLVEALFERGAGRGWRFFFLGGRPASDGNPSIAEAAAANVERRYPGVKSAGFMHGYFSSSEDEEVVRKINESGADILLVGMGAPRQEKWMWRSHSRLSVAACVGVGGTLDVLAGVVKRAPPAFRRAGVEWLYRLATQPSRFRRMLSLPVFAAGVLRERLWRDSYER